MCGIAGIVGEVEKNVLIDMIGAIKHRGPDFQDTFIVNEVGLAHARLSIIDLSKEGNQPMYDPIHKIVIVFNGEIYNFKELKKTLKNKYAFKSNSDTEVLLFLYKEYGKNMLQKINGMFVFAIYDLKKKELFIAKDRMGKKPFYYTELSGSFLFASELKAILKHPKVNKTININALNQYLTFDYVPTPNTLIKDVYKLEAGHYMIVRNRKIVEKKQYWFPEFQTKLNIPLGEAIEKFDSLLDKATADRLVSDVPLGVFLSGGLDSSTVAYYAQKNAQQRIQTFSIGFEDKSYDESDYAKIVSEHIGSEHYSEILTAGATIDLIQEIYPQMDEPFADASLIPTYYLSKLTKKKVTVALGGDGSDELLAGYPTFISNKFKKIIYATRYLSLPTLKAIQHLLPVSDRNISLDFKVSQFLRGFTSERNHIHQLWLGSFLKEEKSYLLKEEFLGKDNSYSLINAVFDASPAKQDINQIIHYYCQTYLHDDILVKVDRASMLNSLEVRAPFLDTAVIEFINSLPTHYKLNKLSGKYILKKLMEGKLPDKIIYRPKKGFGIPLSRWLREDLKPICDELFSKESIEEIGLFNYSYIQKIRYEHENFKKNNRKLIWNLLIFIMWYKQYLK